MAFKLSIPITTDAGKATDEIKILNKELNQAAKIGRLADKELAANGDSAEALASKKQALNAQIRLQTDIAENQRKAFESVNVAMKEAAEKATAAAVAYHSGKQSVSTTKDELEALRKTLDESNKDYEIAKRQLVGWGRDLEASVIKTRTLEAALKDTTKNVNSQTVGLSELGKELQSQSENARIFGDVLKANLVADAITGAFKSLVSGTSNYLSAGVKSAEDFSVAQTLLASNMRNAMDATQENVAAIIELTSAQQKLGVVSQTVQVAGAQELATYLEKSETLQNLIPVMNDMLAQQNGINATQQNAVTVGSMLGKVMNGQVGALSRYGYSFTEAQANILKFGDEAQRAAVLIDVVSASVANANENLAKTDAGRLAQLNMILADTQQRIGEVYNSLRAEVGAALLPDVEKVFTDLLRLVEENRDNISALMGVLQGLVSFLISNRTAIVGVFTGIGGAIAGMKIIDAVNGLKMWITAIQSATVTGTSATAAHQALTAAKVAGATATEVGTAVIIKNNAALVTKTATVKALTAAMLTNPLFIGAVAIGGIALLAQTVGNLTTDFERQKERVSELTDEYHRLKRETEETERQLEIINRRIGEIRNQGEISIVDPEELARLERVAEILEADLFTQKNEEILAGRNAEEAAIALLDASASRLVGHIENLERLNRLRENGGRVADSTIKRTEESIEAHKNVLRENIGAIQGFTDNYEDTLDRVAHANEVYANRIIGQLDDLGLVAETVDDAERKLAETTTLSANAYVVAYKSFRDLMQSYRDGEKSGREYTEALREMLNEIDALAEANPELENRFRSLGKTIQREISTSPEHLDNLRRSTGELSKEVDIFRRALAEQNEAGALNFDTALRLIESGYATALAFDAETGAVKLCADAMTALANARIEAHRAELEASRTKIVQRLEQEERVINLAAKANFGLAASILSVAAANATDADAAQERIAAIDAQIAALRQLENTVGTPASTRSGGSRSTNDAERARQEAEREEEKARLAAVAAWERHYKDREGHSRAWIDRQKFYNNISFDEEAAANERVLAYLREYLADVVNLEEANAEERLRIERDLRQKIEQYERSSYSLQMREDQEDIRDMERAARLREEMAQRDIDRAQSDVERYRAYAALRVAIEAGLQETLDSIKERYWYNERDRRRAEEDAHREFARNINRIDQQMHDLRLRNLQEQATQWRTFQSEQLDEAHRLLDEQHRLRRDELNRELELLREHYAKLDAEERRWERGRNLQDLLEEENVWANAATQGGQERLRNIRRQIEDLQRQEERENRNIFRQQAENDIRQQIATLDTDHKHNIAELDAQRKALQQQYEIVRENVNRLAKDAHTGIMEAGSELTAGISALYDVFGDSLNEFNEEQINAGRELADSLNSVYHDLGINATNFWQEQLMQFVNHARLALSMVNFAFGATQAMVGSVVNHNQNDNSRNLTLTNTNNFYGNDRHGLAQANNEMLGIAFRGAGLRV